MKLQREIFMNDPSFIKSVWIFHIQSDWSVSRVRATHCPALRVRLPHATQSIIMSNDLSWLVRPHARKHADRDYNRWSGARSTSSCLCNVICGCERACVSVRVCALELARAGGDSGHTLNISDPRVILRIEGSWDFGGADLTRRIGGRSSSTVFTHGTHVDPVKSSRG